MKNEFAGCSCLCVNVIIIGMFSPRHALGFSMEAALGFWGRGAVELEGWSGSGGAV